jgi:DNA-binding XRE family transcriptional regulator
MFDFLALGAPRSEGFLFADPSGMGWENRCSPYPGKVSGLLLSRGVAPHVVNYIQLTTCGQLYMMDEVKQEEPRTLAELRANTGLTQLELAFALKVQPQTIASWEKGAIPAFDKAVKLADVLGISVDDLAVLMRLKAKTKTP